MKKLFFKSRSVVSRIITFLPWMGIAFLGSMTIYSAWFLIVELPYRDVPLAIDEDQKRRLDLINSNRENILKVIQTIAGLGFIATAFIAWQNFRLTEDKNISERFSKAVEMLSSDNLNMRLGGIYSLERIAKDLKEDHAVVMEILAAFIRDKAVKRDAEKAEASDNTSTTQESENTTFNVGGRTAQDIQSALIVIGRVTARKFL